jgi:phosphoribosylformimino-5-aminoimidazole carboxamide ribotide isomerase
MIIYPALDLRGGQVVRLRGGDPAQQTVYSADPLVTAQRWIAAGAAWLHVVNLDGALGEAGQNEAVVGRIAALGVPVQFGGGLRSAEDVSRAFGLGVRRVVVGTLAVEQPETFAKLLETYGPEALCVALDARDGLVAVRGWQETSSIFAADLGAQLAAAGARHALYTDVRRDGALSGVNVAATAELARVTGLTVIASGGVASVEDVRALRENGAVAGVVLGTALYEGRIDLGEALRVAAL